MSVSELLKFDEAALKLKEYNKENCILEMEGAREDSRENTIQKEKTFNINSHNKKPTDKQ